jgi:nicotinate-nucleotide adenylyltransferase
MPPGAPGGLPAQAELRLLRLPSMPESATEVRGRVVHGQGIAHLVPPRIASYIETHRLYQPT